MSAAVQSLTKDIKTLLTSINAPHVIDRVPESAKTTTLSMVEFTIKGQPVSVNHLYFTTPQRFRAITKVGKNFKTMVGWTAKQAMMKSGFVKQERNIVLVTINFFFKTMISDIDNCSKALLDSMTGVVYGDDKQVMALHLYKHISKDNPRAVVLVTSKEDLDGK